MSTIGTFWRHASRSTGKIARNLNGTDQVLRGAFFDPGTAYTLLMNVRLNSPSSDHVLWGNRAPSGPTIYWQVEWYLGGIDFLVRDASSNIAGASITSPASGLWFILAARRNGGSLDIFANTVKGSTGTASFGSFDASNGHAIGRLGYDSASVYSPQSVAGAAFVSRAMGDHEIRRLKWGDVGSISRLTHYWPFQGDDLDRVGANHLTQSNSPTWVSAPPVVMRQPRRVAFSYSGGPSYTIPRIMHHLRQQGAA